MTEQIPSPGDKRNDQAPYLGLAKLMTMTYHGRDMQPVAEALLERSNTGDANAMMDLSTLLQLRGDPDTGLAVQAEALRQQQIYHLPAASEAASVRLLAIKAPGEIMGNTPVEFLVEGSDISMDTLYIGGGLTIPQTVPDHDVMMLAIGESTLNRQLLEVMEEVAANWPRPVINRPGKILRLTRENISRELEGIPDTLMPRTVQLNRDTLTSVSRSAAGMDDLLGDGDFPIIIRPIDSHAGQGLCRIATASELADYLASHSGDSFYVSRFIDYRSDDGLYRKFRVAFVDGRAFPSHMAVSDHWMIHYLNAGMAEDAGKRHEESLFMDNFEEDFLARHKPALTAINDRLGLDYFAIDCAETTEGTLLIFEADSAMVVHAMDPIEDFPYKHRHMPRIFDAFRQLLIDTRNNGDRR